MAVKFSGPGALGREWGPNTFHYIKIGPFPICPTKLPIRGSNIQISSSNSQVYENGNVKEYLWNQQTKKLRFFEAKKKKKTLNKIQTTTTRDQKKKKEKENIQL